MLAVSVVARERKRVFHVAVKSTSNEPLTFEDQKLNVFVGWLTVQGFITKLFAEILQFDFIIVLIVILRTRLK